MKIIDTRNTVKISNIPRNFATEPVTAGWRDLLKKMQEAGTPNNITFTITFENTVTNGAVRILYGSAYSDPFGIRQESNGNITVFTAYAAPVSHSTEYYPFTVYTASAHSGAFLTGRHTVKVEIIGTTLRFYLDDVSVAYAPLVDRITPLYNTGVDSAAGYLYDIQISSDDEILWYYPASESERLRLITKDNIKITDGFFNVADSTAKANIKSKLDLSGFKNISFIWKGIVLEVLSTYTVIWIFRAAPTGSGRSCLLFYPDRRLEFSFQTDYGWVQLLKVLPEYGNLTISATIDFDNHIAKVYINGILFNSISLPVSHTRLADVSSTGYQTFSIGDNAYYLPFLPCSSVMIFDGVLSEDEIKKIS